MAARGTESKNKIFKALQDIYPNAFWEDEGKILRVPLDENGNRVEIKVSLTAAKSNLGGEDAVSAFAAAPISNVPVENNTYLPNPINYEPTDEEKANIEVMLKSLGL